MSMNRTNKILTGVLCLGIAAIGTQVAYGMGQSSAKAAWARGVTVCVDRTGAPVSIGKKCTAGTNAIQLASSSQLVAAIDSVARDGVMPTTAPAVSALGSASQVAPAPTATVYVTGPAGPQGAQGAQGATGPSGPAGSGGGGGAGCPLRYWPDFTGQDFSGCTIFGLGLDSSNWTNANLSNASFMNSTARSSNFTGANLSRADLTGSIFTVYGNAGLNGANVTGVDFTKAAEFSLGGTHLVGLASATLRPEQRAVIGDPVYGDVLLWKFVSVPGIDLHGRDLGIDQADGIIMDNADLHGATMQGFRSWAQGSFRNANLRSVTFGGSGALMGADLTGADLTNANLSQVNIGNDVFAGANLTGTNLTDATAYGTNFHNATGTAILTATAWLDASTVCRNGSTFAGNSNVLADVRSCINGS